LHPSRRQLHNRQGGSASALFNLVAPLVTSVATDTRITDTSGQLDLFSQAGASGAVSPLIGQEGAALRRGDVDSANDRSTPTSAATPGTRTSTTATRTTGTRTTSCWRARSAGRPGEGFSFGEWVAAWRHCRRTKRNTPAARAFEDQAEQRLVELHQALDAGTYTPGPSICFAITRPKRREVFAAGFADRVGHHLLYNAIAERFERAFIADSCACIPGRGTLYGARRLETKVRSITQNWSRPAYYLKCDVDSFFVSIDKRILERQLVARIPEPHIQDLTLRILHHDPRVGVVLQDSRRQLELVPRRKSLMHQPAHLGLPIGNLSSQFFANVYLDAMDQFVTHRLRVRHYVRYVDDFILLHESPQQLNAWRDAIAAFLEEKLALRLNDGKTILQPIDRGVDFVGQVVKPWRTTIRRRTVNAALERVATAPAEDLPQVANSYFGLFRQASHSARDRARLANVVRRKGGAVDQRLTKAYA